MMYACVAENPKNPSETDQRGFLRGREEKMKFYFSFILVLSTYVPVLENSDN